MPAAVAPVRKAAVKPESLPSVKFVDITKEAGIAFVHYNGALGEKLLPETMGSGVAFLDYDGDGDQDLFFVNSSYWPGHEIKPAPTQALYRNDGKGHFEDVTKEAGLDKTFYGQGVAVGDYDNDGDPDLYVTALGGGYLFRNDGKGHFDDVTEQANARGPHGWLTGAAFFDIENDGDLDLFICNYITWTPEIDKVQGFQLTGHRPGLRAADLVRRVVLCPLAQRRRPVHRHQRAGGHPGPHARPQGAGRQVARASLPTTSTATAWSTSPWPTTRSRTSSSTTRASGKFEEIAIISGVAFDQSGSPRGGMGIDWAAFKNDDRLGLAIGNFANEMTALYVCDQPSTLQFSDLANLYGLGAPTQPPLKFGLFFFDYDLDGRLDLLSANGHLEPEIAKVQASETYAQPVQLFWNTGQPGRGLFRARQAGERRSRPVQADRRPRHGLRRHRRRRRPRRRPHRQQRPGPPLPQRRRQPEPLAPPRARRKRQDLEPRRHRRQGRAQVRRHRLPPPALPGQELPLVGRAPADLRPGKADQADEVKITWPSGKVTNLKDLKADRSYRIDEDRDYARDPATLRRHVALEIEASRGSLSYPEPLGAESSGLCRLVFFFQGVR